MAIGFRASAQQGGQSLTASITVPGSVQAGDVMILMIQCSTVTATPTIPAGWTQIGTSLAISGSGYAQLCYKVAAGGDPGTTINVTLTNATNSKWFTLLSAYSGVDTTTPIHASSFVADGATASTHATPTLTVSATGCWIVSGMSDRGSPPSTAITLSTGTIRGSSYGAGGGGVSGAIGDSGAAVATGSINGGSYTGTASVNNATVFSVALKASGVITATTSAKVYGQATKRMLDALLALGTLKAYLLANTYTFDRDNQVVWSDVSSHQLGTGNGYTAGGQSLTGITTAYDSTNDRVVLDADPIIWTPGSGQTLTSSYCVLAVSTGVSGTSPLLEVFDFGGSVASDGPLTVIPDTTDGFYTVTVAVGS
jgi:hypothetical protein